MRKIISLIAINLFFLTAYSQIESPNFLTKTNQKSISAEFIALSYSYAYKFKPNVTVGARIQVGYGLQFMITSTSILHDYGYGDGPQEDTPHGYSFEVLKLQLFYRHNILKSFYFDVGPTASVVALGEDELLNPWCVGIEASAYYYIGKMHLGIRLKGAMSFDTYNSGGINYNDIYYALYVTPIVIGYNF
jgi:hypothetical protein